MAYTDAQLLPISALQHLLFCERQCALIHVERLWAENRLTVEGGRLHRKAHEPGKHHGDRRGGVRVARGLELASHRLGLRGVADVVEFRGPPGFAEDEPPVPVEYKRGRPKRYGADEAQLCAQAMCLEEMLSVRVPAGAIFYGQTRRRLDVAIDAGLRGRTEAAAQRLHEMMAGGITPTARREPKCDRCSLLNLCLPDALRPRRTAAVYFERAAAEALAAE